MNWIALSSEPSGVIRDPAGVPVEWTLLRAGDTPLCQEGRDGVLQLTADHLAEIVAYHHKKGEEIPLDSEHYLFELAERKHLDEAEALRLFPGGVAALGYGTLRLTGEELRINVKWTPAAYEMLREKIYKYFSPVIRGLETGPLRVTSVAMTNTPAINHLDALAARAENHQPPVPTGRKEPCMGKLEKAIQRLLGRDAVALGAETSEEEKEKVALEVEEKASLLEQVKTLLQLPPEATTEEVLAALRAEAEKAQSADAKQQQLDELAASAEKEAHTRLVEQGRAEGKITDADMDYVKSLDSKALSAHLALTSRKVPVQPTAKPARKEPADTVALTAEVESACKRLGLDREAFLKAKKERIK